MRQENSFELSTNPHADLSPCRWPTQVETHIAPSFTIHPVTKDDYAAYNKPEAVIDWLQHVTPVEEYVLVLDSDMTLRRPFLVEVMKPRLGLAISAKFGYMIGVDNELALRHIPGTSHVGNTHMMRACGY